MVKGHMPGVEDDRLVQMVVRGAVDRMRQAEGCMGLHAMGLHWDESAPLGAVAWDAGRSWTVQPHRLWSEWEEQQLNAKGPSPFLSCCTFELYVNRRHLLFERHTIFILLQLRFRILELDPVERYQILLALL